MLVIFIIYIEFKYLQHLMLLAEYTILSKLIGKLNHSTFIYVESISFDKSIKNY